MSEEQQQVSKEKAYPAPVSAKFAGGALITALPVLAHFGPTGLLLSGIASLVAYRHGPEIYDMARDTLPFLPSLEGRKAKLEQEGTQPRRSFWDRALGRYPDEDQAQEGDIPATENEPAQSPDTDEVFISREALAEVPGVRRIKVDEIVKHTERNSYRTYIGRSLTHRDNPAVPISFYKRHIKIIGASQMGKSSMAAALLDSILRTHDPERVLVALLDMEDQTSNLFADDPHIVQVKQDGKLTSLHARSKEQVLEHLELIVQIMDYRYTLSKIEVAQQPLLLVYLEEFLALKDYFKARAKGTKGPAKEQAIYDYERLVYCIKEIARRGLKVLVQFLMCAQVDYRDDDLQEALINVTSGICFCVRSTAANAAGFYQNEMLNRNAKDNKVGQAVVEMPDCKDLILAPEYDLEKRLIALERVSRSHAQPSSERGNVVGNIPVGNSVNAWEQPGKPGNTSGNEGERSREMGNVAEDLGNVPADFTPAEETQVLLAYAELLRADKPVTRRAIRDALGWGSRQFTRVIKPVCDKHHIAVGGE